MADQETGPAKDPKQQAEASSDRTPHPDNVSERWAQWMERSSEISANNQEPRTSRLREWWNERRVMREEARLAAAERARIRREERAVARAHTVVERDLKREQITEKLGAARASLTSVREAGLLHSLSVPFERRWVRVVSLVSLVCVCALGGALAMRTKQRRYQTAVLVAINGVTIRRSQLLDALYDRHGPGTLQSMVDRELRRQFIASRGATATAQQIDERFKVESKSPDFWKKVGEAGRTEDTYRESLGRVLGEINLLTKGVTVTEPELQAFYKRNTDPANPRARFYVPAQVVLALIVTVDEASIRRAAAELAQGRRWDDVAKRYSIDSSAERGGVLPPISLGRSLFARATGLEDSARRIREGEQQGPLQRNGYWWLIRCLAKRPAVTKKYADILADVRLFALLEKGEALNKAAMDREFQEFRQKAQVQTFGRR